MHIFISFIVGVLISLLIAPINKWKFWFVLGVYAVGLYVGYSRI